MKKILALTSFALASLSSQAFATGASGCGLGSMLFKSSGKIPQLLSVTTNHVFGTQTFGITTGTSNCNTKSLFGAIQEQRDYMLANFNTLQKEAAQGQGETVDGLAKLMGCSETGLEQFKSSMKENYGAIFSQENSDNALFILRNKLSVELEPNTCQYLS